MEQPKRKQQQQQQQQQQQREEDWSGVLPCQQSMSCNPCGSTRRGYYKK
jgi:membrane protease subunit (stomatin/prohibitin family)